MTNFTSSSEKTVPTKANPLICKVKERYTLSKDSLRTSHVVLDTKNAPIEFAVGDSVGIFPENHRGLVEEYLQVCRASGDEIVKDPRTGLEFTFHQFLLKKANLTRLNAFFFKKVIEHSPYNGKIDHLLSLLNEENKANLHEYIQHNEPLDLLKECKEFIPLQELANTFGPLLPRFYSIASSPKHYPEEIHLTVALTTHEHKGNKRYGVASYFLCDQAILNETPVPIFIQKSLHFRLPEDGATAIIMVGPGTGIAPYKAFMEERIARRDIGKSWLFFGERKQSSDFFYEDFWKKLVEEKKLKLTCAFSRDQEEKIYVQHKMYEHKKELWNWLQEGAIFYVCGDASRMAKDVEATLQKIAEEEGNMDHISSREYIKSLRKQKRYLADVY